MARWDSPRVTVILKPCGLKGTTVTAKTVIPAISAALFASVTRKPGEFKSPNEHPHKSMATNLPSQLK
jgi:hypothetical protein